MKNAMRANSHLTPEMEVCEMLSSRTSNELTALLSYKLRTPLNSIREALSLLSASELHALSDGGQHLLSTALQNTEELVCLMEAIESEFDTSPKTLSDLTSDRLRLENDLRLAWKHRELQLFYQPITALDTRQTMGFEALARWLHPKQGWISPTIFIPFAEQIRLIEQLGLWVLRQACRQLYIWQQQFPMNPPLTMSVNVSSLQLNRRELALQVERACREAKIAPSSLRLEITESTFIENSEIAIACLQQLKDLGIQLYLDDFGTGYSSLSRLQDLPIDVLKIDRSFVSQKKWQVIWSILLLAESLGLEVITEGVETLEELEKLKLLGCKQVQGFFFSPPVDSHTATGLISESFH
ncbi:MAG: EAL domain-containing protein [Geitlerinemataceae cyanobacterium]